MDWKSHAIFAAIIATALAVFILKFNDYFLIAQFAIFAALSALIPDLDHSMSKGRQILDKIVILGSLIVFAFYIKNIQTTIIFALAAIAIYFILFTFFKPAHRGITHSLVSCLVFSVLVYLLLDLNFAIAGFVGYSSHLLADREIKLV